MTIPIAALVASRGPGDPDPDAGRTQGCHEGAVAGVERVAGARVEPEWLAREGGGILASRAGHVVAREVGGIVEGALRRLAACLPERRRMATHGAEAPPRVKHEVIRA